MKIFLGDLGYTKTDENIYEVQKEYDGREVVVIKPSLQFKVAMAGAIIKEKPQLSAIENILKEAPTKNGIWISKSSREEFLKIINEITTQHYIVDSEGYLVQEQTGNSNEIDKAITKIIKDKKLRAFDISSITYLIDEVSGEIEEYPFEDIDPETPFEYFETNNESLYVLTSNSSKKMDYKNIIKEIIENM